MTDNVGTSRAGLDFKSGHYPPGTGTVVSRDTALAMALLIREVRYQDIVDTLSVRTSFTH